MASLRPFPRPPVTPHSARRGFALLITITLLAFLVLLLVSLASLTRVETQVASNNQSISSARQNALMALNLALGQLQKYAGPDQRVTTTADLLATTDKAGTAAPAALHTTTTRLAVAPGARFWTAVWGNNQTDIRYDLRPDNIPPTAGDRRGVTPGLLNWLVSGNESTVITAKGTEGGVSPGTGITYTPDQAIDLSNLNAPTIGQQPAVLLVGANSVGSGAVASQDFVAAPLVNIEVSPALVPGADASSSTAVRVGRYAWWIGDEGVKARLNLQNGYQKTGQASDQLNSFLTAQRSAVEFMDNDPAGTASPVRIGADFDFTNSTVPRLLATAQLPLANSSAAAQTRLGTAAKNRFHDLTAQSFGILSDTYAGGLKKDLTADIADTSSASGYRPGNDAPIFTPLNNSESNLPTWGLIRDWVRTNPAAPGGPIDPVPPDATRGGIYPTLSYFSLGMEYYLDGGVFKMAFYPFVVLHNPYPVPIAATDYDVGLRLAEPAQFTVQIDPEGDTSYTYNNAAVVNLNTMTIRLAGDTSAAALPTFLRLTLRGQVIPPGQRHIYLLPNSQHLTAYSHATPPVLERAPDSNSIGLPYFFTLNGPAIDTTGAAPSARIRIRVSNTNTPATGIKYSYTSFMLAKAGSLASSTWNAQAADIYQGMHNVVPLYPISAGFSGGTGSEAGYGVFCASNALGSLLSEKQNVALLSAATSAIRIASPYEGEGTWSSSSEAGFFNQNYYISRPYANGCLRAPFIMATAMENSDPLPSGFPRDITYQLGAGLFGARFVDGTTTSPHPFIANYRYTTGYGGSSPVPAIFWDVLDSPDQLLSLGQLQHVPLSRYDFQPSYLFANSYADKRVARDTTYRAGKVRRLDGSSTMDPIYDSSWLLNRALWDKYFVSGVPSSWTQGKIDGNQPLPNARLAYYSRNSAQPTLDALRYGGGGTNRAYDEASANLLVAGAFNINSTSEQAWRAVLAGTYRIPINASYASSGDGVDTCIPYPRFIRNMAQAGDSVYPARPVSMKPHPTPSGPSDAQLKDKLANTLYFGNRGLYLNADNNSIPENPSAEAVVAELARSIVKQIRQRGPFLSLADFINRPLTAPGEPAGIKGVIQAGIDGMDPTKAQVNPITYPKKLFMALREGAPPSYMPPQFSYYSWDKEHSVGGIVSGTSSAMNPEPTQAYRSVFAMAPKYLSQADILSSLGPALSPRSDTFTIRAYGEKTNPVTHAVEGRAWCEAVVQRTPDFVNPAQAPTAMPAGINSTYGRRFQVVSFRWISPQDL